MTFGRPLVGGNLDPLFGTFFLFLPRSSTLFRCFGNPRIVIVVGTAHVVLIAHRCGQGVKRVAAARRSRTVSQLKQQTKS